MRKSVWAGAISASAMMLGLTAAPAGAQACRGTAPLGKAVGTDYGFEGALIFPENGTGFSGEFKWSPSLNLALNFRGAFVSDVGQGIFEGTDVWQFGGDGAYRFYAATDQEFPLDVCLNFGFLFHVMSDLPLGVDENGFIFPFGVSIGNDFPLGQSRVRIAPYFSPMFGIQRVNLDGADETDGLFYVDFGASFIFPKGWYLGLGIALGDGDRVPSGDTEFRIRGGWLAGR